MTGVKSRRPLLALLFVSLIFLGVVGFMLISDEHKTSESKQYQTAKPNMPIRQDIGLNIESAPTIAAKQHPSPMSTPLEHDQLVVSSILEGTSIDGSLRADVDGNLILDIGVRDFFDYFLSIADELGPEQAIGEIQRYALRYLPEPASSQASDLLGNYLRYKQTEFQIQRTPITQESLGDSDALQLLRTSFNQLKQKRQSLFSAEQDQALFGLEDSYANHTLLSLELMANENLSAQQKRAQLKVLEAQLPHALSANSALTRNDRERQTAIEAEVNSVQDDAQLYDRLSQQGLDQQQIDTIVSRRQQQREFDATYQRYIQQRQRLDNNSDKYEAELTALQNTFFTSPESRTQAKLRDLGPD